MQSQEQARPSFDELQSWVDELGLLLNRLIAPDCEERVLGLHLTNVVRSGRARTPRRAIITLALLSDCLRAAEALIQADGQVSAEESEYVYPLVCLVSQILGRERPEYRDAYLDPEDIRAFLARYKDDDGLFGYACQATQWIGLAICQRTTRETGDGEPLALYRRLQTRLTDEVLALSNATLAQADPRLAEVMDLRARLADPALIAGEQDDPRVEAFLSARAPQVFSSAAAPSQVWERDPLDVDTVHAEARDAFERLITRVTSPDHDGRGRMLLVLGESGSGKTHLMRAFRSHVHGGALGFVGYMQLTSRTGDYADYVLRNLVSSLDKAYDPPASERSGLMLLSDALAEIPEAIAPADLARLREDDLDPRAITGEVVSPLVDRLLALPGFERFDPDLLRVLLYLQRNDRALNSRIYKYLRCEELAPYDRELLGGIASRAGGDGPQRTIEELGRLMWQAGRRSLVILVDQLEDIIHLDDRGERFHRAVDVLRHVTDNVPTAVVVISCLDDLYASLRPRLTQSARDRLEHDPDRIQLTSRRTGDEIADIVSRRLQALYEDMEVRFRPDDPLFPFRRADLDRLANLRIRDVLDHCRQYHDACIQAGEIRERGLVDDRPDEKQAPVDTTTVAQAWNDHRNEFAESPPIDDDAALLALLARALDACAGELGERYRIAGQRAGSLLCVTAQMAGRQPQELAIGLCNKGPQGGHLGNQIRELVRRAGARLPVLVRCTEFPSRPGTKIARQLGALMKGGARQVVIGELDWQTMLAYLAFAGPRQGDLAFSRWRREEQPLATLKCFRDLLDLESLAAMPPAEPSGPAGPAGPDHASPDGRPTGTGRARTELETTGPPAPEARTGPPPGSDAAMASPAGSQAAQARPRPRSARLPTTPPGERAVDLGHTGNLPPKPLALDLDELTRHAAFLGSTGSGKTTLALSIIEQALVRGVPVILVDRKGDLCRYADPAWWDAPLADPEREARKQALRERVDVHVYTPGEARGRALSIPVIPPALATASTLDRGHIARHAAAALAAMMEYRQSKSERIQENILAKAIDLLGALAGDITPTIDMLIEVIDGPDEGLMSAVGRLAKPKYFDNLVENLELIKQSKQHLLAADAEPLDAGRLLAPGPAGGKTRLSIISTKFLRDNATIEFWVARLVVEIARWASKHPASALQALLLFDEADIYMPALGKPATKEPMQDLLKRARSAGVGVFLATQNPGDLDYKSRENVLTWFVGRVTEERNLGKMKALFSEYPMNIASRLAKKKSGEFFVLRKGQASELKAARAAMDARQLPEDAILALARGTCR